jgi:aryl-alcohol dehydrogenase-like predicted oxidoreductase
VPMHETLGAFGRLIEAGKVRAIGASNYTADRFADALKVSKQHNCRAMKACSRNTTWSAARTMKRNFEPLIRARTSA